MKIVHIVGGDLDGGAAKGAYNLHLSLNQLGVDSTLLINSHDTQSKANVIPIQVGNKMRLLSRIRQQLNRMFLKIYNKREKTTFSADVFGVALQNHESVKSADIINIHWVNDGCLSLWGIRRIIRLNKPVVITLRDMNNLTGGCHYAMSCERYLSTGCGSCPQLSSNFKYDISYIQSKVKFSNFKKSNVHITSISKWLSNVASSSVIMNGKKITYLPNIVSDKDFDILDKDFCREVLKIDKSKPVLLIGAVDLSDYYKGGDDIIKILNNLKNLVKTDFQIVIFGKEFNRQCDLDVKIINLGFIKDQKMMNIIYSLSSVFMCASRMEAFGKTVLESLFCGTPVVAYNNSGMSDIISHHENGFLVDLDDIDSFSQSVASILNGDVSINKEVVRDIAIDRMGTIQVAEEYKEFYTGLIDTHDHE